MTREEQIAAAAELLAGSYRPEETWVGGSGLQVAGGEVAEFLAAVIALVEGTGWTGGRRDESGDPLGDVDESSVLSMVRAIFRWLREELRVRPEAAWIAMQQVAESRHGDRDLQQVAGRCVSLVLRARTGAVAAYLLEWEERRGRTWEEVRDLLETAARFAREHGPRGHEAKAVAA